MHSLYLIFSLKIVSRFLKTLLVINICAFYYPLLVVALRLYLWIFKTFMEDGHLHDLLLFYVPYIMKSSNHRYQIQCHESGKYNGVRFCHAENMRILYNFKTLQLSLHTGSKFSITRILTKILIILKTLIYSLIIH